MARRFRWRFEAVQEAKVREEERKQEDLAKAQRRLAEEERRLAELREAHAGCVRQLEAGQAGRLNPTNLQILHAYRERLNRQISEQARAADGVRAFADEKRKQLLETVKERKVLENLREQDQQKFRLEERRKDQATMDEMANRRAHYNRDMLGDP